MKAILGSLLCLVLVSSECFAIKGGPPYPGGSISLIGTYAGVLQPAFDPTDPFSSNSLGVFTLGIPSSGASTGIVIIFTHGRVYGGSLQGITDPNKATVSALISATFTQGGSTGGIVLLGPPPTTSSITGPLNAKITASRNPFAGSSLLLTGSAIGFLSNDISNLQDNGDPIIDGTLTFDLMGFRQSSADPGAGTLTPPSP